MHNKATTFSLSNVNKWSFGVMGSKTVLVEEKRHDEHREKLATVCNQQTATKLKSA